MNYSEFGKNVFKLVLGSSFSSAISVMIIPIIVRLYTPEAFGIAAIFLSVSSILGVIACLRYEQAIVLPEDDAEAVNILALGLVISVAVSALIAAIVYVAGEQISGFFGAEQFELYLWFLPFAVLFHGMMIALTNWNVRKKVFENIAFSKVGNQVAYGGVSICFGYMGSAVAVVLIMAQVTGRIFASLILLISSARYLFATMRKHVGVSAMIDGLKRYRKFPIYGSWSILLGVGAWQLPILLMGGFFSPMIVGFYALGFKILQLPMNLIGSSIGQVFFQNATIAQKDGKLDQVVMGLYKKLVMFSLFPMLFLTFIGKDLYTILFGEEWAVAGQYTQILSIWAFFWFVSGPFTTIFSVLEKQEIQLRWNIVNFISRLSVIVIAGLYGNIILAITGLAFVGVVVYGAKILITLRLSGASIVEALTYLSVSLAAFIPFALILFVALWYQIGSLFLLLLACMLYFVYAAYCLYKNQDLVKTILKRV